LSKRSRAALFAQKGCQHKKGNERERKTAKQLKIDISGTLEKDLEKATS
jgi:hypothetical protein